MTPIDTRPDEAPRTAPQVPCPSALHGLFACFPVYNNRDVKNYLLAGTGAPYVAGAAHLIGWDQVEAEHGVYNWTIADNLVNQWGNAGKPSVLLLAPVSYGGVNRYLPSWYSGATVDSNTSSACQNGVLPVYWSQYFITEWQNFLSAAMDHYGKNPDVVGIRPGFGIGFENFPANCATDNTKSTCGALLATVGYSAATYHAYLEEMISFCAGLSKGLFQWSVSYISHGSPNPNNPQTLAQAAVDAGLKVLVSAGLCQDDKTSSTGTNDWLDVLQQQRGKASIGQQTIGLSDPTGTAPPGSNSQRTGSLTTILPWAVQVGVQYLELYCNDLLAAWCPTNSNPGYAAAQEQNYPATLANLAARIN